MKLVIGNKNYSSWSLRPWLLMSHAGIPFEEVPVRLFTPGFAEEIGRYAPANKVPALIDGDIVVWDSLAVVEYLAERFPDRQLWPQDPAARGLARYNFAAMTTGNNQNRRTKPL